MQIMAGSFYLANHFELLYLAFNGSPARQNKYFKPAKGVQQPRTLGDD